MNLKIRRALARDAKFITDVHRRSIKEICSANYSSAQIAAWVESVLTPQQWELIVSSDFVLVVSDSKGDVFGFGHLEIGRDNVAHIAAIYLLPEILRQGFGTRIARRLLTECGKLCVHEVMLNSTLGAKLFYDGLGFRESDPHNFAKFAGVRLDCISMTKKIKAASDRRGPCPILECRNWLSEERFFLHRLIRRSSAKILSQRFVRVATRSSKTKSSFEILPRK